MWIYFIFFVFIFRTQDLKIIKTISYIQKERVGLMQHTHDLHQNGKKLYTRYVFVFSK